MLRWESSTARVHCTGYSCTCRTVEDPEIPSVVSALNWTPRSAPTSTTLTAQLLALETMLESKPRATEAHAHRTTPSGIRLQTNLKTICAHARARSMRSCARQINPPTNGVLRTAYTPPADTALSTVQSAAVCTWALATTPGVSLHVVRLATSLPPHQSHAQLKRQLRDSEWMWPDLDRPKSQRGCAP